MKTKHKGIILKDKVMTLGSDSVIVKKKKRQIQKKKKREMKDINMPDELMVSNNDSTIVKKKKAKRKKKNNCSDDHNPTPDVIETKEINTVIPEYKNEKQKSNNENFSSKEVNFNESDSINSSSTLIYKSVSKKWHKRSKFTPNLTAFSGSNLFKVKGYNKSCIEINTVIPEYKNEKQKSNNENLSSKEVNFNESDSINSSSTLIYKSVSKEWHKRYKFTPNLNAFGGSNWFKVKGYSKS